MSEERLVRVLCARNAKGRYMVSLANRQLNLSDAEMAAATVPQPSREDALAIKAEVLDDFDGELSQDARDKLEHDLDRLCALAAQAPANQPPKTTYQAQTVTVSEDAADAEAHRKAMAEPGEGDWDALKAEMDAEGSAEGGGGGGELKALIRVFGNACRRGGEFDGEAEGYALLSHIAQIEAERDAAVAKLKAIERNYQPVSREEGEERIRAALEKSQGQFTLRPLDPLIDLFMQYSDTVSAFNLRAETAEKERDQWRGLAVELAELVHAGTWADIGKIVDRIESAEKEATDAQ